MNKIVNDAAKTGINSLTNKLKKKKKRKTEVISITGK